MKVSTRLFCMAAIVGIITTPALARNDTSYHLASAAQPGSVTICHGFGCTFRTPVVLLGADRSAIRRAFGGRHGTPEAERRGIARAVQVFEQRVGARIGFTSDRAGNEAPQLDDPTQLDCLDETHNTIVLLEILDDMEMLRHHRIGQRLLRGFIVNAHNSAAVVETRSGSVYAVDSWPRANGKTPDILPAEEWRNGG